MNCLTYAIHYLSKYPKTTKEMEALLHKKGFSLDDIQVVIPQLTAAHYLDDESYARAYLQSEVCNKGKSLLFIQKKLIFKGVDKSLVAQLSDEMSEDIALGQQQKIIKEVERLRAKGKSDPEIIQTLVRKGFAYQEVKKNINLS